MNKIVLLLLVLFMPMYFLISENDNIIETNMVQARSDNAATQELDNKFTAIDFEQKTVEKQTEQTQKEHATTAHVLVISLVFIIGLIIAGLCIAMIVKRHP